MRNFSFKQEVMIKIGEANFVLTFGFMEGDELKMLGYIERRFSNRQLPERSCDRFHLARGFAKRVVAT